MFKTVQIDGTPGSQMRSRWAMFVVEPAHKGPGISMLALRSSVYVYNQQPGVFPSSTDVDSSPTYNTCCFVFLFLSFFRFLLFNKFIALAI